MKDDLTKEEDLLLSQIERMGKWESLIYDLSTFIPSAIIIILSASYNSKVGIWIGLSVYFVIHFRSIFQQCQSVPILKSGIEKLRNNSSST